MKKLRDDMTILEFCHLLLDNETTIDELSIFDYLEQKTRNWDENRIRIIMRDMDYYYNMEYLEELDAKAQEIYICNGWDFPTKPLDGKIPIPQLETVTDWEKMRDSLFCGMDYLYHKTMWLLKSKLPKLPQPEAEKAAQEPQPNKPKLGRKNKPFKDLIIPQNKDVIYKKCMESMRGASPDVAISLLKNWMNNGTILRPSYKSFKEAFPNVDIPESTYYNKLKG